MFFRREKPRPVTFEERLGNLTAAGFDVLRDGAGRATVTRNGCGAVLEDAADGGLRVGKAGVLIGKEIGTLVDVGYQKIFRTPGGAKEPVLAAQLKSLHAFVEDLREVLGLTSLYNESLGTTNDSHMYDRVVDRDRGVPRRPWER